MSRILLICTNTSGGTACHVIGQDVRELILPAGEIDGYPHYLLQPGLCELSGLNGLLLLDERAEHDRSISLLATVSPAGSTTIRVTEDRVDFVHHTFSATNLPAGQGHDRDAIALVPNGVPHA